mgnify:CR=1 FL=1
MCFPRLPTGLAVAAALAAAGCASPPERAETPAPAPEGGWTADAPAATDEAPDAWLRDFGAPRLRKLVDEALRNNPGIAGAAARLSRAASDARVSGAAPLPSLNLGVDSSRQKIGTFGPQSTGGVRFEDHALDLNLSWEIDLWGRLRDRTSAALATLEAGAADYRGARLSLAARVAKAWLDCAAARQQVSLAANTLDTLRANTRTIAQRFDRGLSAAVDLRRIRARTETAAADLASRREALDRAKRSLERILGRYPAGALEPSGGLPSLDAPVPAGMPADLLRRRPDLVAAERRLAAAEKEADAARKERLPAIRLTASGGTSTREFRDLLDRDFSVWSLAANLTQPVFEGGRITGNIERAEALRREAAAEYRDTALQAFFEVERALAAEQNRREALRRANASAGEAAAAERLAWSRYKRGTGEFLELLDARRTATDARIRRIDAHNRLLQNRVDLYLALGGPFATGAENAHASATP